MAERQPQAQRSFQVPGDQPLIGLVFQHDGHDVTHYFAEEEAVDAAVTDSATSQALQLIGAWSDLDWGDMAAALDRIRHESPPSVPIEV